MKAGGGALVEWLLKLSAALVFTAGFFIFMYPFLADALNNYNDQLRLAELGKRNLARGQAAAAKQAADRKEQQAAGQTTIPGSGRFADPFTQETARLSEKRRTYLEERCIGALFIPKIRISLPIYDRTDDFLLEQGATVMPGASLPTGGKNSHAVLTGHTGFEEKRLFTDLDQLRETDQFFLHVAGVKLAYEVFRIQVVEPDDFSKLAVVPTADLVTLLTCTPYGINSQRLLVQGRRIPYPAAAAKAINNTKRYHRLRIFRLVVVGSCGLTGALWFICSQTRRWLIRGCRYRLCFRVTTAAGPWAEEEFQLVSFWLRRPVKQMGQLRIAVSDETGQVDFGQLPGGHYRITAAGRALFVAKIRRVKATGFRVGKTASCLKSCDRDRSFQVKAGEFL